jgi:hypothetical protein
MPSDSSSRYSHAIPEFNQPANTPINPSNRKDRTSWQPCPTAESSCLAVTVAPKPQVAQVSLRAGLHSVIVHTAGLSFGWVMRNREPSFGCPASSRWISETVGVHLDQDPKSTNSPHTSDNGALMKHVFVYVAMAQNVGKADERRKPGVGMTSRVHAIHRLIVFVCQSRFYGNSATDRVSTHTGVNFTSDCGFC